MSKVTAADKLIARGFDYSIDGNNGIFDPYYDDADVLKQLEINPALKAVELSKLTKLSTHRVIAAMMRLKAEGKLPVNPPPSIVVEFPTCSKGNIETAEPLTVLTVWQPWATFIAKGIKTFETRGWIPDHSGRILIHASASHKLNWLELDIESLEEIYPDVKNWDYPLGAIVAEAELINCHQVEAVRDKLGEAERLCGNYSNGRYAWELTNVKPLFIPNVKGKQKLWKYAGNIEPLTISDDVVLGESVETVEPEIKPDIPHWLTGRNEAEAIALFDLGFWCIGSVDNWGEVEPKEIIEIFGDWQFNSDQSGLFIEARCNGAVFNREESDQPDNKLVVAKAIAAIKEAAKRWGEQFGEQLNLLELIPNCEQSQNILLQEPPRLIEPDGQISIFFDDSEEPPDPDDYPDNYKEVYSQWAVNHPEIAEAIAKSKAVLGETMTAIARWEIGQRFKPSYDHDAVSFEVVKKEGDNIWLKFDPPTANTHKFTISEILKYFPDAHKEAVKKSNAVLGETFQKGDRVQQISNSKWVGEVKSISKKGVTVRYCCGFEFVHTEPKDLKLFTVENSYFKLGDLAITKQPGFENKTFLVNKIHESGMTGVLDESDQPCSFPTSWLILFKSKVESITPKVKETPKETTRKRPAKGCGSGYLMTRAANVKRNEAKGKSPDIYYVYCYSYSNQYGKEIKSSISVPRAKIAQVKKMVEDKEHYVKIAKFLGKSLPLSY